MQNNSNKSEKPEWQNIAETQSEHELNQGHKFWLWAYRIGVGGSFTALAIFIIERMSGTDAQIWNYTGGQALNALVGLIFAFAFSAFVYGFYLTDYSIKQRLFVFAVAVIFPLFAEVSQTMHRGEESQKVSSEASPEFIAAQKALDAMTGANPAAGNAGGLAAAAGEKAKHEAELKACARYESATRREKCQRYEQGKIAEADGKVQGYTASGNAALTAHKGNLTSMIGTIKELGNNQDHAHSMVKLFMEMGVSLLVASLIMAVLIIGSIETALAWLGDHVKNHQKAMRARGLEIGNQKKAVVKAYRPDSSPAPLGESATVSAPVTALHSMANSAKQTVGEYAQKVEQGLKTSPEIIAREYARADHANKQVLADAGVIGGKIGAKLDELAGKPDQDVMNEMLKTIRTQLLNGELEPTVKALYPAIEKNLHDAGYETPKKTVTKLAENLLAHLAMKDNVLVKRGGEYQLSERYKSGSDLFPPAPLTETDSFKQSPEQLAFVQREHQKQMDEYERAKQSTLGGENTVKYLTPKMSVEETVKHIQASVKQSGATLPDVIQAAVFDTFAAMPNPAPLSDVILERIAGKLVEQAVTTVHAQPEQTRTEAQPEQHEQSVTTVHAQPEQTMPELTAAAKQAESDLYPEWVKQVSAKAITSGARDSKRFISQATFTHGDKTVLSVQEMGRIWLNWQDRAARAGVLKANPKYQPNNRQPKYLLAA